MVRWQGKRGWLFVPIALLLSLGWWMMCCLLHRSRPLVAPFAISHRGAANYAPENTLAGVVEAIRRGAHYIEVDVQRSADGQLVVIHDDTVDRTTDGSGHVGNLDWSQLQDLDAGCYFGPQFAGEPIPTLDDVLTTVLDSPATLVLEAKSPALYPGIEHQIADALKAHEAQQRVVVVSFDHDWLARFHALAPQVRFGPLFFLSGSDPVFPQAILLDVHWSSVLLHPALVQRAHARGQQVVVWTVNHPRLIKLMLALGVDGVTTDSVDRWWLAVERLDRVG